MPRAPNSDLSQTEANADLIPLTRAKDPTRSIPATPFRGSRDRPFRPVVPALLPDAARPRGNIDRAGLAVDHSTMGRWVLRYAPELHKRLRRELRPPNRSWRVDETYIRV